MNSTIIYEDNEIIVCEKMPNLPTQTDKIGQMDLVSVIKNHLAKESGFSNPYLGVIHRLDQPVHGVLVFAKTPLAAKELTQQITNHTLKKYYYAITCGQLMTKEATLVDYLVKEAKTNFSKVVSPQTPGAKKAELTYRHVETKNNLHLMEIDLLTGRHHQIRVQMAHAGLPLLGDVKYGNTSTELIQNQKLSEIRLKTNSNIETDIKIERNVRAINEVKSDFVIGRKADTVALCAYKITFSHPKNKKQMTFEIKPSMDAFQIFDILDSK